MRKIIFALIIGLTLFSCNKYKAKRFSGIYNCTVNYFYFDITGTTIDTTYTEDVEVKQEGESIVVFDKQIHVRDLRNGATFEKQIYTGVSYKVKIDKGELYYFSTNGGLGGSSSIEYIGKKK